MLESETILITGERIIINVPNHVDLNDAFLNKQNKTTFSAQMWYVPFSHAPATLKRKANSRLDPDRCAHLCSLICVFSVHQYVLQ